MTTHDEDKIIAQQARIEQLTNFIKYAQVSSGVCCCGDSMEGHPSPMTCGHSPVDMWDYHSGELLEAYPDDLSALRAHDEKLRAQYQRQPIETAPKMDRKKAADLAYAEGYRLGSASRDAEIARLKTVPMRYRRMAFNARLQDEVARLEQENDQLRAQIAELVEALEWVRKVTLDFEMHDAIDFALDKVRKP